MNTFNQLVEFLRHTFFLRWDRHRRWRLVQVADLDGADGRCEVDVKKISILRGLSGDHATVTVIHEIFHAVSGIHHGKNWQRRMELAARRANDLGMNAIAELLRQEIVGYREAPKVTATMVYNEISDLVWSYADITFLQAVDSVRRDYGLSRSKFLKRFRRGKAVFAEAKREAQEKVAIEVKH
jgi:hypothetical protein